MASKTTVNNIKSGKTFDLYIGHKLKRGRYNLEDSPWRNPYNPQYRQGLITADESVGLFFHDLLTGELDDPNQIAKLPEVQGKVLACWYKPGPCHGDVIARLADALDINARETTGGLAMTEIEKNEPISLDTLAQMIDIEHRAFIGSARKTLGHGIRAGELLNQAKNHCQHGEWLPWLDKNFVGAAYGTELHTTLQKPRCANGKMAGLCRFEHRGGAQSHSVAESARESAALGARAS